MSATDPYDDFIKRLTLLISKRPHLIVTTLSNIFTMRLIGNKTHGDLAEIAVAEFINQYMYDYSSLHVGKDLYRKKTKEEDIKVINDLTQEEFPISLKAYGVGPLQLSTDKSFSMFPRLEQEGCAIRGPLDVAEVMQDSAFSGFRTTNVLPLIYDEVKERCNILVFDYKRAIANTVLINRIEAGRGRIHPVYRFYDIDDEYVCEVRYGGARANALQRGLWTHTKKGSKYFTSITRGWIDYSHNKLLVRLFSHALVASSEGHKVALSHIIDDIERLRGPSQQ